MPSKQPEPWAYTDSRPSRDELNRSSSHSYVDSAGVIRFTDACDEHTAEAQRLGLWDAPGDATGPHV